MMFRKICEDTASMNMTELVHNCAFIRDGEVWYRDFEREISLRDLMREICSKHAAPADAAEISDDDLDDMLRDNMQFGTDDLEGIFSMLNFALCGLADVRAWLKNYLDAGLPEIRKPGVIKAAIEEWGERAQADMALEEMSELTKAILKHRRAEKYGDPRTLADTREDIIEEIADVYIMLAQLSIMYDWNDHIQKAVDYKIDRLARRLGTGAEAARAGADGATQGTLAPAT